MTVPGVTACLIVRDEQTWLPECLDSLVRSEALAEICVLDTGSTDGTIAIAREYGCRVEEWVWRDDFAAARNRAVDMAHTEWVLIIDADERLVADVTALVGELREAAEADLLMVDVDDERDEQVISTASSVRLYRPATMTYRNRVHEVVARRDGAQAVGRRIARGVCRVRHLGYSGPEAMDRRGARNLTLARMHLEEMRRGGSTDELIAALVNRGRAATRGSELLSEGLPDWLEAWSYGGTQAFRLWAGELSVLALIAAGRLAETAPILSELAACGTDERQIAWLGGRVLSAAGRHREAWLRFRAAEGRVSALGEQPSDLSVLLARLESALNAHEFDDAAQTAARLVRGHRRYGDALEILVALTRGIPEHAVRLLTAGGSGGKTDELVDTLRTLGDDGRSVADILASAEDCGTSFRTNFGASQGPT